MSTAETERPVATAHLPFTFKPFYRLSHQLVSVFFYGRNHQGVATEYYLEMAADPKTDRFGNLLYRDGALAQHIWDTVQALRDVEQRLAGAIKERDDALAAVAAADGRAAEAESMLEAEKARTAELRRQAGDAAPAAAKAKPGK